MYFSESGIGPSCISICGACSFLLGNLDSECSKTVGGVLGSPFDFLLLAAYFLFYLLAFVLRSESSLSISSLDSSFSSVSFVFFSDFVSFFFPSDLFSSNLLVSYSLFTSSIGFNFILYKLFVFLKLFIISLK